MGLTKAFPERRVVEIWQNCLSGRADLITEDGEPLKIIYPGRINDDRGADFLDAVIATSHGLRKGDVEIHVKSSNWRAHRHHLDPVYNRVILHVVFWHDTKEATTLQNGEEVPTLVLHKYIKTQTARDARYIHHLSTRHMPCRNMAYRGNTSIIGDLLDTAGEERFLAKTAGFRAALAQKEASQSLYQGIMAALGYTRNKHSLMELAQRMPLRRLESINAGKTPDAECLMKQQALLLGTAGLLPSQRSNRRIIGERDDNWVEKLEKAWASSRHKETMSEDDWHLFKVRPSNLPIRRIVAMSYLLTRYREKGILEELVNRQIRDAPADMVCQRLEKALHVNTDGYWASHLELGFPGRTSFPALLGDGRAAVIVVNVLLPFAAAWGKLTSQPELAKKAFDIYRHYPELAANAVERHMKKQLGISRYLVNSAQRQQGLIHIYKSLCSQGKCHDCPIGEGGD